MSDDLQKLLVYQLCVSALSGFVLLLDAVSADENPVAILAFVPVFLFILLLYDAILTGIAWIAGRGNLHKGSCGISGLIPRRCERPAILSVRILAAVLILILLIFSMRQFQHGDLTGGFFLILRGIHCVIYLLFFVSACTEDDEAV